MEQRGDGLGGVEEFGESVAGLYRAGYDVLNVFGQESADLGGGVGEKIRTVELGDVLGAGHEDSLT